VIEDCVTKDYTRDMLEQRITSKFGADVLDTVLAVTHRKHDDDGDEFSPEEKKEDYLSRLAKAGTRARWVCAADKLHNASSIISDLQRTIQPDSIWTRFKVGKEGTIRWYRSVYERLRELGFDAPIMAELEQTVKALEKS
jgi:(p)ppGpp synthase/HD superfamily hydrolase